MTTPTEPTPESAAAEPSGPEPTVQPARDPMKSFRGIMAGALVLEAIVVALAIPVVAHLGGGMGTAGGVIVLVVLVALLVLCGLLRYRWSGLAALGIQVVLIASWFAMVALGVVGVLFALVWIYLLRLRRDVARRIAAGTLPSQQS